MRAPLASCCLLALVLGCQSSGRSVETAGSDSSKMEWRVDRWGNSGPAPVEVAGDPSQEPLEGPDDAAFAPAPAVKLPDFEVGEIPKLKAGVLALATVVDGHLQDGEPPERLKVAFEDLREVFMVRGSDFATHQQLSARDLCLAARIGRAELLLLCAVDAGEQRWRAWLFDVDTALPIGCVDAGRLVGSDAEGVPELDAVFSDLALLLAGGVPSQD